MSEDLKGIVLGFICAVLFVVVGIFFVMSVENKAQEEIAPEGQLQEDAPWEWISPDGVHYWVIEYGIGDCRTRMMAPRYTKEGQLIIEEK